MMLTSLKLYSLKVGSRDTHSLVLLLCIDIARAMEDADPWLEVSAEITFLGASLLTHSDWGTFSAARAPTGDHPTGEHS